MKKISFSKLNGQGNDFIIIDSTKKNIILEPDLIKKMCNRNFGIGADGLIIIRKSKIADFKMDFFNMDGSRAEMCGNGIRCMARFIYDKKVSSKKVLDIDTLAGIKNTVIKLSKAKPKVKQPCGSDGKTTGKSTLNHEDNTRADIRVDMGFPQFDPGLIPLNLNNYKLKGPNILDYELIVGPELFRINCVSMGNPHCVIFLDDKVNLNNFPVCKWGPELENHPFFPKKTNVEFVKIINDDEINMRVWERGVGETLACGTGACASVVCTIKTNKTKNKKVSAVMPGGKLCIHWENENSPVFLEGPVDFVFDGYYFTN